MHARVIASTARSGLRSAISRAPSFVSRRRCHECVITFSRDKLFELRRRPRQIGTPRARPAAAITCARKMRPFLQMFAFDCASATEAIRPIGAIAKTHDYATRESRCRSLSLSSPLSPNSIAPSRIVLLLLPSVVRDEGLNAQQRNSLSARGADDARVERGRAITLFVNALISPGAQLRALALSVTTGSMNQLIPFLRSRRANDARRRAISDA